MTMIQHTSMNPNYLSVVRGLLEMYRLTEEGRFDSPEADAIRDAMDEPWERLSESERERVREWSAALNAIADVKQSRKHTVG